MDESEIIIGTPVTYYSLIKENGKKMFPKETKIASEAWSLGSGTVVCSIEGVSGGVNILHLEIR